MTTQITTTIYALCEPGTMEIRYVGKSINPKKRYSSHLTRAKTSTSHVHRWIYSLLKRNTKPDIITLEEVPSNKSWQDAEIKWIAHYRSLGYDLTNYTPGGDSGGATYGRLGKKNSQEHILKTRLGRIGKPIKRNPASNIKRAEGIRRYRKAINKKVYQYSLEGYFIKEWSSTVEAAIEIFGTKHKASNILAACKKNNSSSHGFQWKLTYSDKIEPYQKKESYNKGIPMPENIRKILSNSKKGIPWSNARKLAQQNRNKKKEN